MNEVCCDRCKKAKDEKYVLLCELVCKKCASEQVEIKNKSTDIEKEAVDLCKRWYAIFYGDKSPTSKLCDDTEEFFKKIAQ